MEERRPDADANELLLARIEMAKAWDRDDERYWRDASPEEHARAIIELSLAADAMRAARGEPWPREPLSFPRFDGRDADPRADESDP